MNRSLTLAVLLAAAPLAAQSILYSVPNADPTTGTLNVIPFGDTTSSSSFANCRYQTIVGAADMGNVPTIICGLRFAAGATGQRHFDRLTVRMGHTSAAVLSTTFDVNLPPATASTVLDAVDYYWHNETNVWNDIGLQNTFVYNGTDNLVIEVIAINAVLISGTGTSGFHRDTRQRVYVTSYNGTQTVGSSSAAAAKLQLHFADASAWTFGRGCAGSNGTTPALSFTGEPAVNQTFAIDLTSGAPNFAAVLLVGVFNSTPFFPYDLGSIGATGCLLYHDVILDAPAMTDPTGAASIRIPVASTAPICAVLYTQWLCLDVGANTANLTASNYGRLVVGY